MPQPKRADDSSDFIVNARVTLQERARIREAAAANRQTASEFIRDVVLDACSETLDERPEEAQA